MLCTLLYVTLTKFHALLFPCSILKWCGCVLGIGIGWITEIRHLKLHLIFCQTCSDKNSINKNKKRKKKKIWIFHSLIWQIMRKFSIQHIAGKLEIYWIFQHWNLEKMNVLPPYFSIKVLSEPETRLLKTLLITK